MGDRRALLVVGMHYGGSAAVARSLSLLGATPPRTPFSQEGEVEGETHWGESDPIVATHDQLLASASSSWDDVLPFPADWHRSPAASEYGERMAAIVVGEYLDACLFVVNDPRICRLVPFWIRLLDELEARPAFVLPVRDPREVVGLLADRDGFSRAEGLLLWLRHMLDAERETRGQLRAFVAYRDLLSDPISSIEGTLARIGVDLPGTNDSPEPELEDLRLVEERPSGLSASGPDPSESLVGWVEDAYACLLDSCRSADPPDLELLDRLGAALSDADLTYGAVLAESRLRAGELRDRLAAERRKLELTDKLREHAERRFRKSEAKLRESERQRRESERQRRESERQRRESERQRRAAEAALASVLESPSWRVTKPLRAIKALINRVRGVTKRT